MRRVLRPLGAAFVLLAGVLLARTARYRTEGLAAVTSVPAVTIPEAAAARLAEAVRIPTVSPEDPASFEKESFRRLHAYLQAAFPRVHSALERETVSEHSLLYTWPGTSPALRPILLMGHLDVVPVEPGTEPKWHQPPFGGRIADGFVWGRGAIDNKSTVLGTLEAVEMLLGEGFRPARTVHLAYGHDEEVGGKAGAQRIAALLESRGVQLEMVLDEGGVIAEGVLSGVRQPVALVGIAEKGFATIELTAQAAGGHSSLPPAQSAVGILSAAIARLEQHPMPARLAEPTARLFRRVGPLLPFAQRLVFANLWLTRRLVVAKLEGAPTTNAMIRTTAAPTIFQAGTKDNVLPANARAVVNFRILPGDTVAGVVEHVRRVVDDARVQVKVAGAFTAEPSPISSPDAESFRTLERTIRSVAPEAVVAPYQVVVVTDARYFTALSPSVFRFLPVRLKAEDLQRMHGTNERLAVDGYHGAVRTYRQLILNAAGG